MPFVSLKAALSTFLNDQSTITDIVSDRIYGINLPQQPTFPALLYTILPTEPQHDTAGSVGVTTAVVQFDCVGRDSDVTDELREALRMKLDGRSDATFGGLELMWSHETEQQDFGVAPEDGKSQWLFRSVARYRFKIRQDIPTL